MIEKTYGTIILPNNIDITDPSYDEDIWCRVNNYPIGAGEYECYAVFTGPSKWGNRVKRCGLRKVGAEEDTYYQIAIIGVDSGMAGFFNCENVKVFDDILAKPIDEVYKGDNYFVTSSGYGDGSYYVYSGKSGIYIEFIED